MCPSKQTQSNHIHHTVDGSEIQQSSPKIYQSLQIEGYVSKKLPTLTGCSGFHRPRDPTPHTVPHAAHMTWKHRMFLWYDCWLRECDLIQYRLYNYRRYLYFFFKTVGKSIYSLTHGWNTTFTNLARGKRKYIELSLSCGQRGKASKIGALNGDIGWIVW